MKRESRILVFAAALLAAALGLYRALRPARVPAPILAKTPPPTATAPPVLPERPLVEPPKPGEPSLSNEQLQQALQEKTRQDGIEGIAAEEAPRSQPFLGPRSGVPGTRRYAEAAIRELQAARHAVERGQPKAVPIEGKTAALLAEHDPGHMGQGLPLETADPAKEGDSWTGLYSGGLDGTRTISDDKSWQELWPRLSKAPLPQVDFNTLEVVGILLGPRPTGGYTVGIVSIEPTKSARVVSFKESVPPEGKSPPEGATSPWVLRAIPRSDLPVRFTRLP